MIRRSSVSRSPTVDRARLTSWTSATFFCSRRSADSSDNTSSGVVEARTLPSAMGGHPSPIPAQTRGVGLLHAAAAEVVFVEAFEVTDLVQQRVADLLGKLGAGLYSPGEVLAIQHDRRRLVAGRGRTTHRTAVDADDRRWERRRDGLEIGRVWQVSDLDLDRLDAGAALRREAREDLLD